MTMAKGSGKSKKHGNNKIDCQAYRSYGRREKNKKIKLLRHVRATGRNDNSAWAALKVLKVDRDSVNLGG
jgi:hypothetical protein